MSACSSRGTRLSTRCFLITLAAVLSAGSAFATGSDPTGACCKSSTHCWDHTEAACDAAHGTWLGEGTSCATADCSAYGACCYAGEDFPCKSLTQAGCDAVNGQFLGTSFHCNITSIGCGACCDEVGGCDITGSNSCAGDFFRDSLCTDPDVSCPLADGACCEDSLCDEKPEAACTGFYHGDGSSCTANSCDGACCENGDCSQKSEADCTGEFFGVGEACTPELCDTAIINGRMTGGGHQTRVGGARVTRGLTIHCDLILSNNLEVNWGGNSFHMTEHLTTVECSDDPDIIQAPPQAPLDTLIGVGTGRYNGVNGFTIEFTLVDAGEPGRDDLAALLIYQTSNPGNVVLDVPLQKLTGGNLQAHADQPHK